MKNHTTLFVALGASVALAASTQAGGHHGGARATSSSNAPSSAQGSAPAFHSAGGYHYSGGRGFSPSARFSSSAATQFRQHQFASRNLGTNRFQSNAVRNSTALRNRHNAATNNFNANRGNRSVAHANQHVFARHASNWHRDWDRHHDHWWNGHRCRYVNGSWIVFDLGFSPWYGYPYDYYPYDYYYPYAYNNDYGYGNGYGSSYGPPVYDGTDAGYNDSQETSYDSSNQYTDSSLAAAQERLARRGYYHGAIDGIFGPSTRRALLSYQRDQRLRVTGSLTSETLRSLGTQRVAEE